MKNKDITRKIKKFTDCAKSFLELMQTVVLITDVAIELKDKFKN